MISTSIHLDFPKLNIFKIVVNFSQILKKLCESTPLLSCLQNLIWLETSQESEGFIFLLKKSKEVGLTVF